MTHVDIDKTLEVLNQGSNNQARFCVKKEKDGRVFLQQIDKSKMSLWNRFLRLFNAGTLKRTHFSPKKIASVQDNFF